MIRVFIIKEKQIEYIENQETGEQQEIITEVGEPIILNVDNEIDAERLISANAWEMPQEEVLRIFGDKVHFASNENTTFEPDGQGGYTNFVFTSPAVNLEALKQDKVNEAITAYNTAISNLAKDYPTNEMLTFTQQLEQAQNITAQNNLDDVALIKGIAIGRKMTTEDLALKILSKNKAFQYPCGVYLGRKQRVQDLVERAQTEEEVNTVDVVAIFAEPLE